jgi:hypothetical protein
MARLSPSGEPHATLYPPRFVSAVATRDYTITLTWYYRREDISRYAFERTNLTFLTTEQFEVTSPTPVANPPGYQGGRTWAFDDTGLDPQTSYRYRLRGAVHPPGDPEVVGVYGDPNDQANILTATTINTPFEPAFQASLNLDSGGWEGYCLVQRITGFSRTGSQLRITVRASSDTPSYVDRLFISKPDPAGGPYDSASDLMEVHPKFEVKANRTLTLPAVRYTLHEHEPLLIALDFSSSPPAPPSGVKYQDVVPLPFLDVVSRWFGTRRGFGLRRSFGWWRRGFGPQGRAYWTAGAEAAVRNRSPNYTEEDRIYFIDKIEVR